MVAVSMTEALFDEVLEGLESIHKTGLAHMDMKPATGRIWADAEYIRKTP